MKEGRLYVYVIHLSWIILTAYLSIPDGKICLNETGELAVTKFAVEPVR